jgi:hypothetical protein
LFKIPQIVSLEQIKNLPNSYGLLTKSKQRILNILNTMALQLSILLPNYWFNKSLVKEVSASEDGCGD